MRVGKDTGAPVFAFAPGTAGAAGGTHTTAASSPPPNRGQAEAAAP